MKDGGRISECERSASDFEQTTIIMEESDKEKAVELVAAA